MTMMRNGLRAAALFAAYGTIGFGGDYAAALLAQEPGGDDLEVRVVTETEPMVDVVVDVRPEVFVDVQVRHSSECSYTEAREMTIRADDLSRLGIDAGSGELRVEGRQGLSDVVVTAVACASVEEWLDELTVTVDETTDGVQLIAHYPERQGWRGRDNTARLDLTVLVPLGFAVEIDDSSGGIEVTGTGDLRIADSSGSISARGVNGSVSIDDSSGEVDVADVSGDVDVEDSSGGIRVVDVQGSVLLRDGSGGIEVSDVDQDVIVESDGSGSIDARRILGDFAVGRDGSGSIRYEDVGGRVDVPEDKRRRRRGGR
jgi:hypothetical protein